MEHTRRNAARRWVAVAFGLLAVSVSFSFAANGIRINAAADLALVAHDVPIDTTGIRLEFDHGLRVVVTNGPESRVGDVYVPDFGAEVLARDRGAPHALDLCVRRIGIVRRYPGGVAFVFEEPDVETAMAALTAHLVAIGARIDALGADGHAVDFRADGVAYRAVVGADANGTLVYLGN